MKHTLGIIPAFVRGFIECLSEQCRDYGCPWSMRARAYDKGREIGARIQSKLPAWL